MLRASKIFVNLQSCLGGQHRQRLRRGSRPSRTNGSPKDPAERAERARRKLLSAIGDNEPATLKQVAKDVGRGAPAVSRSVDALVRAGLVERTQDPEQPPPAGAAPDRPGRNRARQQRSPAAPRSSKLERLAHSELRAIERAIEILERG